MASASDLTNYFGPISACAIGLWTLWKYRTGRAERAQAKADRDQLEAMKGDANLRDDQRELLAKLYERDDVSQARIERLVQQNDELREQMTGLRREVEGLRQEVGVARRAQERAEARYLELLEQQRRPVNLTRQPPPDDAA